MLTLLFVVAFYPQPTTLDAVYILEKLETELSKAELYSEFRKYWVGKSRVRVDLEDKLTLLYDIQLNTLYLIDHKNKTYFISLVGRDRKLSRAPLMGLVRLQSDTLRSQRAIAFPTGNQKKISDLNCREYSIAYPKKFGVHTRIWSTTELHDKGVIRKIWLAALGTMLSNDARLILNQLLKELGGVPVRTVSTITQEGGTIIRTSTLLKFERHYNLRSGFLDIPEGYKVVPSDPNQSFWREQR